MPRYMLDTNMCIYLMKNQPEAVARRFAACQVGDVVMSAITYAELQYGVAVARDPAREGGNLKDLVELIPVLPFDRLAGDAYGPARLATRERRSDHLDKLIAAHAIAADAVLVTNNIRDFTAYPDLRLENWLDS
ncbi:type II toxin-antitoxin system VapC family toxin [Shinella zoogloeoides]|uniref:Ribonuclease VapC n=1 Tax=Shinella zoogloeoides TaxID=352475 RepID=A0A6N8TAQ6_SHIZO|nr:type II toxin-antitoxin system VapC family toxin [Shinella zoogloeoides]MXO00373.1 PIN domain-containing protein [Shinella zoogloeoides]UEX84026.1 type II toxin-antitoxin system VapC family toxin [Shinella zoogloeoides]